MLDFLKECNISSNSIDRLLKEKYPSELYDLESNKKECTKIINYLKEIGITNIEELLVNKTELFYKTKRYIENKLSRYDQKIYVNLISDDYNKIDLFFE